MFKEPAEGDLLMDIKAISWRALSKMANDRDGWRERVRALRGRAGVAPVIMTTDEREDEPIIKMQCKPKKQKTLTEAEKAARHRSRDAHEAFFRPTTKQANLARQKKAKKKKPKPKQMTDKERARFAREH